MNHTQFVTALYQGILGREPDDAGLKHYVGLLESGGLTPAQVVKAINDSPERNPGKA